MFTVVCVCMCAVLCVVHAWSVMYVLCVCCVHVCGFFFFFFFVCVYNTSVVMPYGHLKGIHILLLATVQVICRKLPWTKYIYTASLAQLYRDQVRAVI